MPLLPLTLAVIVALPALLAVTTPLVETLATASLLLDHAKVIPARVLPLASLAVALSCAVAPTLMDGADELTLTVAIAPVCDGSVTVTCAAPVYKEPSNAVTVAFTSVTPGLA